MFGTITDFLIIVLGFGVLIFVHELGHFVAAKWAGIRAEAFAVGMGPVALAWRRGIGLRAGSTVPEYTKRAHRELVEHKTEPKGRNDKGDPAFTEAQALEAADRLGLGETEYSLRWLPIGGFVKMLGQEDMNPNKTSDDPRSYNSCPIGKRMVVVSAGVIMNIIFAAILYVIAFSAGVRFEAPVLGGISPNMPAASAIAINGEQLGVQTPGIRSGDRVISINGNDVNTFADIQISTAMAKPDVPLQFVIERAGVDEPLHFDITPKLDNTSGLLGIGVAPASSTMLLPDMEEFDLLPMFESTSLAKAGVQPGMTMLTADGEPIETFEQFQMIVTRLNGSPVPTTWAMLDSHGQPTGSVIEAEIASEIALQQLVKPSDADGVHDYEFGLYGMVPLTRVESVMKNSPNIDVIKPGDVILRVGDAYAPQRATCQETIRTHTGDTIEMELLREGERQNITAKLGSNGMLGVSLGYALDTPIMAEPINRIAVPSTDGSSNARTVVDSPIAALNLLPGTRIAQVGNSPVTSWRDLRQSMIQQTREASAAGMGADVTMVIVQPTPDAERETVTFELSAAQVAALHGLGWNSTISAGLFEPLMTTRKADNPLHAIVIGVEETHKTMMLTYLTIDRLIRGSVGVEQLRGPVGIVHIGSKIAGKGFIYILYFLAIISVNLAVINFLPLPIVDGGLFLFLVYEKFKGRPPSPAFQHWATVAGLFMIGTAFLVVTWNDVMRLIP